MRIKNMKGDRDGGPILMKDGVIIDVNAIQKESIDIDKIQEKMRYITKMTQGVSSGYLNQDEGYQQFRDKIIEGLVVEQSDILQDELKKAVEKNMKKLKAIQERLKKQERRITAVAGTNEPIQVDVSPIVKPGEYDSVIDGELLADLMKKAKKGKSKKRVKLISNRIKATSSKTLNDLTQEHLKKKKKTKKKKVAKKKRTNKKVTKGKSK